MRPMQTVGKTLRYSIHSWRADSSYAPLGLILHAHSARGLCALLLGDSAVQLRTELTQRFPDAQVREEIATEKLNARPFDEDALAQLARAPWDIAATPFAHQVWQALRAIPRGQTRSYGQLAAILQLPNHARAIARACASNPLALIVPCHRVIGQDGAIRGYRWGVARKRFLLELEQRDSPHEVQYLCG